MEILLGNANRGSISTGYELSNSIHLSADDGEEIQYVPQLMEEKCCATPYVVMESGCETCKSCGWSACVVA